MLLDLSVSYQKKLIATLLSKHMLMQRHVQYLPVEVFTVPALQFVWKECRYIYDTHKTIPTLASIETRIRDLRANGKLPQPDFVVAQRTLKRLARTKINGDTGYVLSLVDDYRTYRIFTDSLEKARVHLENREFNDAEKIMREGFSRRTSDIPDTDALGAFDEIYTDYFASAERAMPTLIPSVDMALSGGLKPGELGSVLAFTGVGKSMFLVCFGKAALMMKKTVVHITVEMTKPATAMRYYSAISKVPIKQMRKKMLRVKRSLSDNKRLFSGGELYIERMPMTGTCMADIKNYSNSLRERRVYPDVVLIDYADLLSPSVGKKKDMADYDALGIVYTEMSDFAKEYKIPVWTASQTNRKAAEVSSPTLAHMGDSLKKARIADVIISLGQTSDEAESKEMRLHFLKIREGRKFKPVRVSADFDTVTVGEISD